MRRGEEDGRRSGRWLTLFAGALGAATVLGWFGHLHPWLEMLTNIPLHLLTIAALVLIVGVLRRRRWPAIIGAVAFAWFAILLVPYWRASPDPLPANGATVHTALQYNVYFGNDDVDRIVAEIEASEAAVVALHEITSDQWAALAPRLSGYPHSIAEPWDGTDEWQLGGGMALLSRTPLTQLAVAGTTVGRPILAASTPIGGVDVVVVGLHPHASRFESHKAELREQQLDAVVELLANDLRPALILTDMNMAPTSSDYRSLLDDLDWRDPHRLTGWDASWPTWGGAWGLPIDHMLVSDQIALHDISAGGGGGSDHRSLTAQFSLR